MRSKTVLKAFLDRSGPEKKSVLERFLPKQEVEELSSLPVFHEEINSDLFSNPHLLDRVHWSWFLPTLKTYPESEQKFFLSLFKPYAAKNLAKTLTLSLNGAELSHIGKSFLKKMLLQSVASAPLMPIDYLPPSPLNRLLSLSKKELTHLIDLLSMHDLASELRQIVETKILKKIYSLLTEKERAVLKEAALHKDPFSVEKLGLERWDGSEEVLRNLLHKRGLARLGAALSGQDPDLIWYICHQLDIGRGSALYKLCAKEPLYGVGEVILRQIEELQP